MSAILEIRINPNGTATSSPVAHFSIDGREYMICGGRSSVTIFTGKWVNDRRALGKTFHSPESLQASYKRDGKIIREYADQLTNWGNESRATL